MSESFFYENFSYVPQFNRAWNSLKYAHYWKSALYKFTVVTESEGSNDYSNLLVYLICIIYQSGGLFYAFSFNTFIFIVLVMSVVYKIFVYFLIKETLPTYS